MSDFDVKHISTDIDIQGERFRPTSFKTERTTTNEAGFAELEGIFEGGDVPDPGDRVRVDINDHRVFTGIAAEASRTTQGVYTVKAYDRYRQLAGIHLAESTYKGKKYNVPVARDALSNHNIPHEVADGDEFIGRNGPTTHKYKEKLLTQVLDDIAGRLAGYWWIDTENVVHLKPEPPSGYYELEHVKGATAGKGNMYNTDKIVVFGGGAGSDSGQQMANLYAENSIKSEASLVGGEGSKSKEVVNQQITSQEGADALLQSEIGEHISGLKQGKVRVAGNAEPDIYETVNIPKFESIEDDIYGEYKVKRVHHELHGRKGFVTTFELGLPQSRIAKLREKAMTDDEVIEAYKESIR